MSAKALHALIDNTLRLRSLARSEATRAIYDARVCLALWHLQRAR